MGDDNLTTVLNLISTTTSTTTVLSHTGEPRSPILAFEVIHGILTVFALTINCASLVVIYGIVARLVPSLQMLTSLAFADMLAPWAVMTIYFPASTCQEEIHTALMLTSHNASAFTLIMYAVCLNIATFRPLQYEKVLTQRRLWIAVNIMWISSIVIAHIHFLITLGRHDPHGSYCSQVQNNSKMGLIISSVVLLVTFVSCVFIYGKIFLHLRPIEVLLGGETEPRKSTRSVFTGILLTVSYVISYGPYLITKFAHANDYLTTSYDVIIGLNICEIFILANCIAHPLIYGIRMTNMQTGYLRLHQRCRGWVVMCWARITKNGRNDEQPSTLLDPIESIC